jgi:conjugal transfer pilus assembly protein TraL
MLDRHYIPNALDQPAKFLFWTVDVLLLALVVAGAGFAVRQPYIGLFLAVASAYRYNKFKSGRHVGLVRHMLYWHVGTPALRGLPPSHIRQLMG